MNKNIIISFLAITCLSPVFSQDKTLLLEFRSLNTGISAYDGRAVGVTPPGERVTDTKKFSFPQGTVVELENLSEPLDCGT